MGWYASPVAKRLWADAKARYPQVTNLGYIGDQAHQTSRSGHNVGIMAEAHNYPYGSYDGSAVLAVDIGVPDDATGYALVAALYEDDRVLYTIFRGQGRRPRWRGGQVFSSSGHMTHVHTSFTARATHDDRPFALGGAPAAPASPYLDIGGLKVARLGKVELANWIRRSRSMNAQEHDKTRWGTVKAVEQAKEEILAAIREGQS